MIRLLILCGVKCFLLIFLDNFDYLRFRNYPSGDKGTRTLDPLLARQVLSQLSYTPMGIWQPPTFPRRLQRSIIGRISLNHRVRDENGCVPYTHRHQKYLIMFKQSCFKSVRASLVSNSTRFAALVWINPSYASNPLFIHLWKQAFNIHSQSIICALTHCMQH